MFGDSLINNSFLMSLLHHALDSSLYKHSELMINNLLLTSTRPLQATSTDSECQLLVLSLFFKFFRPQAF